MTIARKYIRQCRTLFPVYGKSERTFLNRLKVQVNEHLDLFPDLSYEKLVEQFGTPKEVVKQFGSPREVVMEYYANADDDYLLKRMNFVKHVRIFLSVIAFALIVFFAYRSYVIYESFQEIKDSKIIYENQGSIEELPQK